MHGECAHAAAAADAAMPRARMGSGCGGAAGCNVWRLYTSAPKTCRPGAHRYLRAVRGATRSGNGGVGGCGGTRLSDRRRRDGRDVQGLGEQHTGVCGVPGVVDSAMETSETRVAGSRRRVRCARAPNWEVKFSREGGMGREADVGAA
eukprot:6049451-Prymnesium_polylepis.1